MPTRQFFLGLVEGKDKATRKKIAKIGSITAFLIVASFVLLGKYIFDLFGITIPAFKITGGILIFYVGFEMLMSQKSKVHNTDSDAEDDGVAISPLAIPILAGPGTIVTAMNNVTDASFVHIGIVLLIFALMKFSIFENSSEEQSKTSFSSFDSTTCFSSTKRSTAGSGKFSSLTTKCVNS